MGYEQPSGPPVLRHQRLARPLQRNEVLRSVQIRQRQIGRESLLGHHQTVRGFRFYLRALEQQLDGHSFEGVIEAAPRRDTVDVTVHGLARQREELVVRKSERLLDETGNHERPFRCVDGGDVAVVQHRPFGGDDLARRDAVFCVRGLKPRPFRGR